MELVAGGNRVLGPLTELGPVAVEIAWEGQGNYDICAIGVEGEKASDGWFVFFNNGCSPDQTVFLRQLSGFPRAQIVLDPASFPTSLTRLIIGLAAIDEPALSMSRIARVNTTVINLEDGSDMITYPGGSPGRLGCLLVGEVYRHRDSWKFRAIGQGWPDLSGLLNAFGIDVVG